MSTFAYVSSKLGNVDPETRSIAKELYDKAKAAGHDIWFMWGMGGGNEHGSGNALDLMVRNEAAGDWIRNYIWANRARLRLIHVIWEQHITSTVVQPGVRRLMADRGSTTDNHYDHVHVWFYPGTYRAPVAAVSYLPYPGHQHAESTKDDWHVGRIQKRLKALGLYSGELDSSFGPKTEASVKSFQSRNGLKVDGWVGLNTWNKLKIPA
jgi:hypothetical protein